MNKPLIPTILADLWRWAQGLAGLVARPEAQRSQMLEELALRLSKQLSEANSLHFKQLEALEPSDVRTFEDSIEEWTLKIFDRFAKNSLEFVCSSDLLKGTERLRVYQWLLTQIESSVLNTLNLEVESHLQLLQRNDQETFFRRVAIHVRSRRAGWESQLASRLLEQASRRPPTDNVSKPVPGDSSWSAKTPGAGPSEPKQSRPT